MSSACVAAIVDDIIDLISPPKGFTIVGAEDMPCIETHRVPLETVLRILISNAIKHHDRTEGRIEVSARHVGEFVEFAVTDDGPGIPEEFHDRIFKMFQTLKPRDEVEGSGMGPPSS